MKAAMNSPRHFAAQVRMDTPMGPLLLATTALGLAGAWFDDQKHHPGPIVAPQDGAHPFIVQAIDELRRYFAGAGDTRFHTPLDPQGTPFQRSVWQELLRIAPGRTRTYGQIAQALHAPQSARAVGAAVGRNPLGIIIPCHRVLGSDGSLTGYAGGLHRKQALLALEGERAPSPSLSSPQLSLLPS